MGLADTLRDTMISFLLGGDPAQYTAAQRQQLEHYARLRDYQRGNQDRQLKTKFMQADDNLVVNLLGLVIERSISMLFGQGIVFDLPGEKETEADAYIQAVWKANRQAILLHRLGQLGGVYGTAYLKLIERPASVPGERPGFRLVPLLPWTMRIETEPHDMDEVVRYEQFYTVGQGRDMEAHRYVTERVKAQALSESGELYPTDEIAGWQETHYVANEATGGRWQQLGDVGDWPYPFAPILHCQNLVNAESCYGDSDIAGVLPLQDRYNFTEANISKIIRYHAHPKTWGRGAKSKDTVSWGPDEIVWLSGEQAMVANLEMQTDLAAARLFGLDLRQAIFDLTRSIDTQSLADKLGALTNFGLRVLWKDALDKNHTKRELYGELLCEANRRMLVVAGFPEAETDPGTIRWPEPLPANATEETQAMQAELEAKVASRQTWSTKRGYDFEQEQERIQAEGAAAGSVGAEILRAFSQGQGQ